MSLNLSEHSHIDFYVVVIDNYGDIGFALNLALSLYEENKELHIRFFSNDFALFQKLINGLLVDFIEYMDIYTLEKYIPSVLIFNFFDRKLPEEYLSRFLFPKTIVQFGYFLLHKGIESLHKTEYFLTHTHDRVIHYIPSLLPMTGGIIINPNIKKNRDIFCIQPQDIARKYFLKGLGIKIPQKIFNKKWISIFVYPNTLIEMKKYIQSTKKGQVEEIFFIFSTGKTGEIQGNIIFMPFLSLEDYGVFQSLCDTNIVRGENSLCQALISGKPIIWDIYKEENGAHIEKIEDFALFLYDFFPSDILFEEYVKILRNFNNQEKKELSEFFDRTNEFDNSFKEISQYIQKKSNLINNLMDIR